MNQQEAYDLGNKNRKIDRIPDEVTDDLKDAFLAGAADIYFDKLSNSTKLYFSFRNPLLVDSASAHLQLKSDKSPSIYTEGYLEGFRALDWLETLLKKIEAPVLKDMFFSEVNRSMSKYCKIPQFLVKKAHPNAVLPSKKRAHDSGYDVSAIELNQIGTSDFWMAEMGIAVKPMDGWYFDLVGRSSLPLKGFIFSGAVGVIDKSYTGTIKMILQKIDDRPLPVLPFSCGQLIPRPIIHAEVVEVDDLDDSSRGTGGFGSTDKK